LLITVATTPPPPDYSTPEATLITFHNAFKADDREAEYECLSHEFKRRNGNLGLSGYYDMRTVIEQEYTLASWVLSGDRRR